LELELKGESTTFAAQNNPSARDWLRRRMLKQKPNKTAHSDSLWEGEG
jgi:hypothetical protein